MSDAHSMYIYIHKFSEDSELAFNVTEFQHFRIKLFVMQFKILNRFFFRDADFLG